MVPWLRLQHTVATRLALIDAQLTAVTESFHKTDAKLDQTYREIRQHAEDAKKEVQTLREAGIKRGEQLDHLCDQSLWLKRLGAALLLATLVGLGSYAWDRLIRTPSMATEHKIDRVLEQIKDIQKPQGPYGP